MKIKDANLINNITGTEKVPVSAGTGAPATVSLDQIKDFATNNLAKKSDLPKKTSQLTNDSGFVTSDEVTNAISNAITNTLNTEV